MFFVFNYLQSIQQIYSKQYEFPGFVRTCSMKPKPYIGFCWAILAWTTSGKPRADSFWCAHGKPNPWSTKRLASGFSVATLILANLQSTCIRDSMVRLSAGKGFWPGGSVSKGLQAHWKLALQPAWKKHGCFEDKPIRLKTLDAIFFGWLEDYWRYNKIYRDIYIF